LEDTSFWFSHRNRCIVAAVSRIPPTGPILDVGGGNGFVARALIDAGFGTIVVEPGQAGARNARHLREIPHVICSTLEAARFRRGSLSAVALFDVLEHVADDTAFVDELRSVLRPGGLVYVTVPAHEGLWSAADIHAGHYRRYSASGLSALFAGQFDVLYVSYFFTALIPPLFVFRVLPYRVGMGVRRTNDGTAVEHSLGGERARGILDWILSSETRAIEAGRFIRLGTSCLLIARKRDGGG
jgi:SAM-dependent methyltransferase